MAWGDASYGGSIPADVQATLAAASGIDTVASCLAPFTFASHTYEAFHLLMPLYICRVWEGNPTGLEGQRLAWATPQEMLKYPMPPADKPLVAMLRDFL